MASVLSLRPRHTIVLCAVLAPLLLAACGGGPSAATTTGSTTPIGPPPAAIGPPTGADLADVRRAAAHTLTQKVVVSVDYPNPGSLASPVISGSGSFDLAQATGEASFSSPSGAESLVFQPDTLFDQPVPSQAMVLPQGRPWIRAQLNEKLHGSLFAQFLLRCEARDLGFLLSQVAWGARTAAPLGPRVVGHAPANGYLVKVDLERAAAAATGPRAVGFVRTARLLERIGGGSGRVSDQTIWVWIDRSGRIVALRASVPASGIGTTLMTITSFGTLAVQPVPPTRDQIVDLAALTALGDHDHD